MYKIAFIFFTLTIFSAPFNAFCETPKNSPSRYEFRGLLFGSNPTVGMKSTSEKGEVIGAGDNEKILQTYSIENDDKQIGDLTASQIKYYYFDSKLFGVIIDIDEVSDTVDKILEIKFGKNYKKIKYKEMADMLSVSAGQKMYVKEVVIPAKMLSIQVEKRYGGSLVMPSTKIIYMDTEYRKLVNKLIKERKEYFANKEKLERNKKIRNSVDKL